jgi:hypothetical protein
MVKKAKKEKRSLNNLRKMKNNSKIMTQKSNNKQEDSIVSRL